MLTLKKHGEFYAIYRDYFGQGKEDLQVIVAETPSREKALGWYKSLEAKLEKHYWENLAKNNEDDKGLENFLAGRLQCEI